MYDELVRDLRDDADWAEKSPDFTVPTILLCEMRKAANAIEERDKYALTIQHEMMAEAESHVALVERLNKQIDYLQKQVAYWQAQLTKSMCGETLADLEKRRWIPVTENLPEKFQPVWVACKMEGRENWTFDTTYDPYLKCPWGPYYYLEKGEAVVYAWMDRSDPEPPKEET